jgi:hypothetical protein
MYSPEDDMLKFFSPFVIEEYIRPTIVVSLQVSKPRRGEEGRRCDEAECAEV